MYLLHHHNQGEINRKTEDDNGSWALAQGFNGQGPWKFHMKTWGEFRDSQRCHRCELHAQICSYFLICKAKCVFYLLVCGLVAHKHIKCSFWQKQRWTTGLHRNKKMAYLAWKQLESCRAARCLVTQHRYKPSGLTSMYVRTNQQWISRRILLQQIHKTLQRMHTGTL